MAAKPPAENSRSDRQSAEVSPSPASCHASSDAPRSMAERHLKVGSGCPAIAEAPVVSSMTLPEPLSPEPEPKPEPEPTSPLPSSPPPVAVKGQ